MVGIARRGEVHGQAQRDQSQETIVNLASYVCGSDEEAEDYIEWLRLRGSNLIQRPPLWARVERIAESLVKEKKLSAQQIRRLLHELSKAKASNPA